MSKMHKEKITCPKCGKVHEFTAWDSVNTQLDPEFKEKARNGELFRFVCPDCSAEVNVMYQCLYHQMEDDVMIYFIPNGPVDEAVRVFKRPMPEGFPQVDMNITKRVVTTLNDFKEKLKILDEGLDDRVIEIMKFALRGAMSVREPDRQITNMYLDKAPDIGRYFYVIIKDGEPAALQYDQRLYDQVANDFKAIFDADKEVIIDQNWAMQCMEKRHDEIEKGAKS